MLSFFFIFHFSWTELQIVRSGVVYFDDNAGEIVRAV